MFLGPVVRVRAWLRWERNREEVENWMSWRREQSEGEEAQRRDTWSLVCGLVPPSVVSESS